MESVSKQMIRLLICKCENDDIKKGLRMALNIINNEGYYNLDDWNELSEEEQWEEARQYINI